MVFVRKLKKDGKVYKYIYESRRVNGKVKSIYVGKAEDKKGKNKVKEYNLNNFDIILDKIKGFIKNNELNNANECYGILLEEYNKASDNVEDNKKLELFKKTKEVYDKLMELNKNSSL